MSKPKVYIDGKEGTTGLQIYERLGSREDIELLLIDEDKRKDTQERKKFLNAADLVFLCLPDAAALEAVTLIENPKTKVIDASTAHRTAPGWVYGFPELLPGQQLRKTVDPARGGAVCGGGVDDLGLRILNKGHRLQGGGVGQAEKDQVGGVEKFLSLLGILALVLVNEQQLNVLPASQPLVDLKAGSALLAVNVYLGFAHMSHSFLKIFSPWPGLTAAGPVQTPRSEQSASPRSPCWGRRSSRPEGLRTGPQGFKLLGGSEFRLRNFPLRFKLRACRRAPPLAGIRSPAAYSCRALTNSSIRPICFSTDSLLGPP